MFNSKELRLFVRLCQITGLIPYSIEYDPKTGQFERFSFAWRKFLTWWYVGILVLQGSIAINNTVQVYRSLQTQFSASGTKYLPTAVVILSGSSQLFYFAIVVIVRVTVVRYSRLCKAIQLIREVEQHLQNRRLSDKYDCKNTIAHRAIIGFVLSLLFAGMSTIGTIPSYVIMNPLETAFVVIVQVHYMVVIGCGMVFLNLSYYFIAHYIRMLRTTFDNNFESGNINGDTERLKKSQYVFGLLCKAGIELNHVFSFPALVTISTKLVTSVYSLFVVIYQLIMPNPWLWKIFWLMPVSLLFDWIVILVFFTAADTPVRQARLLRNQVIVSSNRKIKRDCAYKTEVLYFLMQLDERSIRLSACGIFQVGMHLIPTLVASIVTYLVVLLQTQ